MDCFPAFSHEKLQMYRIAGGKKQYPEEPYSHHLDSAMIAFCFVLIIGLFLATLGLCCCPQALSSCCKQGLLFLGATLTFCGGFLRNTGSGRMGFGSCSVWAQWLGCTGSVAPQHAVSSQIRGQTHVSCRWTLTHSTTREVLALFFNLCCIISEAVVVMVLQPLNIYTCSS